MSGGQNLIKINKTEKITRGGEIVKAVKKVIPVVVNGNTYVVDIYPRGRRTHVFVNGQPYAIHKNNVASRWFGTHEDIAVVIDGVTCILVVRYDGFGWSVRVVIDGQYVAGEPFVPNARPAGFIVFFILNYILFSGGGMAWYFLWLALDVSSGVGITGMMLGAVLCMLSLDRCNKTINSTTITNKKKAFICSGIILTTILCWIVVMIYVFLYGGLDVILSY